MTDSTDAPAAREILTDAFTRIAGQVVAVTDDLTEQEATWRPDAEGNTVGWLLWHLSRVQDDHLAGLAGSPQVWTEQGFEHRFGLPFDSGATGFGHSPDDVAAVRVSGADLAAYHAAVQVHTSSYLDRITRDELGRIVDPDWDPPVTASARLVSVINDCTAHSGQAEYVLGLARRAL